VKSRSLPDKEHCETFGQTYQRSLRWKIPEINRDWRTMRAYGHKVTEAISFDCVEGTYYLGSEPPDEDRP
jgi:hypothetical protein